MYSGRFDHPTSFCRIRVCIPARPCHFHVRFVDLPPAAAIEMLMFLSSRNPVLGFLSQAAFYGAIFFMGYVVWRSVSREDSDAQEIQ